MNLKERFMAQLAGKEVDMTPVGCTTTYGMVDLMDKCGAARPLADTDPKAMAKLALAYVDAGFEWCKAMGWDITAVSEVMGCGLGDPKKDIQYFIKEHPFADNQDNLEIPKDFFEKGRFPIYKEQFKILKNALKDEVALFGESEGAFTAACNLIGTEQFMKWTFKQQDRVKQVLEVTTEAIINVVNWAFDQGADYYVLAEPSSGPALMGPNQWKKFVKPVITEICQKVKGPIVLHICANTDLIIPMMCECGVAGISIEEKADLKKAVEIANEKDTKVFGNVATATTLFMGTTDACYAEAKASLENGTHFLTPGCGIAPGSPLENVLQLKKARDDYFK